MAIVYKFDFTKFKECEGRLCPCIVPSRDSCNSDNICPCDKFRKHGKCVCGLFMLDEYCMERDRNTA